MVSVNATVNRSSEDVKLLCMNYNPSLTILMVTQVKSIPKKDLKDPGRFSFFTGCFRE